MVYCGKPSKGCSQCRAKRTKCDSKRPTCGQCVRKGIQCPGYRDELELAFRDQTTAVVQKRQSYSTPPRGRSVSPQSNAGTPNGNTQGDWTGSNEIVRRSMSPSIEDQATCFFFKHYVLDDSVFARGTWGFLPKVYGQESFGSAIADTVTALGMVGLANTRRISAPAIAGAKYAKALRTVNSALQSPQEALSDRTLILVSLLGLYESTDCQNVFYLRKWTKHMDGAVTLLRMRGEQQLHSSMGRRLFVHLRTQILLSCLNRGIRAPAFLDDWGDAINLDCTKEEIYADRLVSIAINFCNTLAALNERPGPAVSEAIHMLQRCEDEYAAWRANVPPAFEPQTLTIEDPTGITLNGRYHLYNNVWNPLVMNHYQAMRILLLANLKGYLKESNDQDFPNRASHIAAAETAIKSLSLGICYSVPLFLGFHNWIANGDPSAPMQSSCPTTLVWPLYAVGAVNNTDTDSPDPVIHRWTIERLRGISTDTGVMQAAALADVLARKKILGNDVWDADMDERDLESGDLGYTKFDQRMDNIRRD